MEAIEKHILRLMMNKGRPEDREEAREKTGKEAREERI